jgi:hypothetical protein
MLRSIGQTRSRSLYASGFARIDDDSAQARLRLFAAERLPAAFSSAFICETSQLVSPRFTPIPATSLGPMPGVT